MQPTCNLVERAKAGDREAIAALVQRYESAAVMSAWTITSDFHHAQDIAQESFVSAFRNLEKLRDNRAFGPWLLTAVRRNAGRATRRQPIEKNGLPLVETVENRASWEREFEELLPVISRLPDQERVVIELRYISGLSIKQVAESTGRPVGTVSKQLSRALERLRELLMGVEK